MNSHMNVVWLLEGMRVKYIGDISSCGVGRHEEGVIESYDKDHDIVVVKWDDDELGILKSSLIPSSHLLPQYAGAQQLYELMSRHLYAQGQKSIGSESYGCAYRGDDDRMCAIGCLIPDILYHRKIENQLVYESYVVEVLTQVGIKESDRDFLACMQALHDAYDAHEWVARLEEVGIKFDLDTSFLTEFDNPL